jgi:predicted cupin superfamily sugar epimerase
MAPHTAAELIARLQLLPHPEGGWYREVFRAASQVAPQDGRGLRSALTSIHFLLQTGGHSRWHRVLSDEVWIHLEGAALDLWSWDSTTNTMAHNRLGAVGDTGCEPQHAIPAGIWQAARPHSGAAAQAGYALATCLVGPGFDFADFSLMAPDGPEARLIRRGWPELADLI